MTTSIVLLRGINVGGSHKLAMATVRAALEEAGYGNVRTYIQSGNIVLDHQGKPGDALAERLSRLISDAAGFAVPLTVRSAAQMRTVVERNPFDASDPTKLVVWFLDRPVDSDALAPLAGVDYAPEQFKLAGREIYLCLPNGQGRGVLPVALAKLKSPELRGATARNWRTVETLLEMASG